MTGTTIVHKLILAPAFLCVLALTGGPLGPVPPILVGALLFLA